MSDFPPHEFARLKTVSIVDRRSLVHIDQFATAPDAECSCRDFLSSLPRLLAAEDLRALAEAIVAAYRQSTLVGAALGAHVVKVGLAPVLIDLMERRLLGVIAMHGAGAIHDFEIALAGRTSEDVAESIRDGSFGMCRETAEAFAAACHRATATGEGLGEAMGQLILQRDLPHAKSSILAAGVRFGVPITLHVALGTDIVHMHAGLSGAELGEASLRDFRTLCTVLPALQGGVWLNIGSAVLLPEVFLKAVSVVRNLGTPLDNFLAANLDMIQHYRPRANVTGRPAPRGISLTGHHEILLPLLRIAVLALLEPRS